MSSNARRRVQHGSAHLEYLAAMSDVQDATYITDIKAVDHVKGIVETQWYSKWVPIQAPNDDGIDGVILLYKKYVKTTKLKKGEKREYARKPTGEMIFVQVKGGNGYRVEAEKRPNSIGVNVTEPYIVAHRPRWNRLPGPVILIFVNTESKRKHGAAWWCNLKVESSYDTDNKQIISVLKEDTFGSHSKGDLRRLSRTYNVANIDPPIVLTHECVNRIPISGSIKAAGRSIYRQWATSEIGDRTHAGLGEVIVSRVGWRHMTRRGRRPERLLQSLQLIEVAKRAIKGSHAFRMLGRRRATFHADGSAEMRDYVGIRVQAIFPHRQPASIQVVLKRLRLFDSAKKKVSQKLWFLSVYEKFKPPALK